MNVFTFVITVTQSQAPLGVIIYDIKGCAVWFSKFLFPLRTAQGDEAV